MAEKITVGIQLANEVVGMTPRRKCTVCTRGFKQKGSVIDSVAHFGADIFIHRRCLDAMLADAPVDVDAHEAAFEGYREKILSSLTG